MVAVVRSDPEAAPEADPDYHQKSRGILVQPIPEPRPICHIEYEVGYSYIIKNYYCNCVFIIALLYRIKNVEIPLHESWVSVLHVIGE